MIDRPLDPAASTEVISSNTNLGESVLGKTPLGSPPKSDYYMSTGRMAEGLSVNVRACWNGPIADWEAFFERARTVG